MAHTTILGNNSSGGEVSLSLDERCRHIALIGASGAGKTNLIRHIARQDAERGDGFLLLDIMGDLAHGVLSDIPKHRHNQVCYLNLADKEYAVGLNLLEDTGLDDRARVVDGFVTAMRSVHFESWGPRLESILRHACTALIETGGTVVLLPRLLTDDAYRAQIVARLSNHETRTFFTRRFEEWRTASRDEWIDPVLNKIEAFLAFPAIKNVIGQNPSTLDLTYAMQHRRIVIVNLSMGQIGESAARLMGALVLSHLRSAAMARATIPIADRLPYHLLCDEVHAFGPASVARLLQETRQFKLSVTLASQMLDALADSTRAALLANAKTVVAFRCDPGDAEVLAAKFNRVTQDFNANALMVDLEDGEAIVAPGGREAVRISIPPPMPIGPTEVIIRQSRRHYGRPRAEIERYIAHQLGYV